ncbi:MAG: hypothetical protein JW712_00550 [Dehalococcoidales bacterium]|nr:hypothetical protein [Dehalococcoidales bacterium]
MGVRLLKYYDEANRLGALKAQMRLAILTKMSSKKAEISEDSADNINIFEQAMQELRKEF